MGNWHPGRGRRVTETEDMEPTTDLLEKIILKTLKKLKAKEFENFKVHLQHPENLEGLVPIPQVLLEKRDRRTIAGQIVFSYPSHAHHIVVNVLKKIHRNDLLDRFPDISKVVTSDQHGATDADPSSSSSTSTSRTKTEGSQAEVAGGPSTPYCQVVWKKKASPEEEKKASPEEEKKASPEEEEKATPEEEEKAKSVQLPPTFFCGLGTSESDRDRDKPVDFEREVRKAQEAPDAKLQTEAAASSRSTAEAPSTPVQDVTEDQAISQETPEPQDLFQDVPEPQEAQTVDQGTTEPQTVVQETPEEHVQNKHFVDQQRAVLIQEVTMVSPILDLLLGEGVIAKEGYSNVRSKTTTQDQMRELYTLLNSRKAKDLFHKGLEEHEKLLLDDLDAQHLSATQPKGAAPSVSDLLVKPSRITYFEDELQQSMGSAYLNVQLGTESEVMFENTFISLYNVGINVTDIHRHHEVRHLEMKKVGEEKEIQLSEIFKDPSGRNKRTVLTVGCAGIGKTFLVHKFLFDWAKKCFPQDPHLVFPLKFRQLNLLKGQNFSLAKLIHHCIKETRFIEEDILNHIFITLQKSGDYNKSPFKVMFVMDGYDENSFKFDFIKEFGLMNVTDLYPVEDLLVNLIKGELLPPARIWITSRPAAANQIPKKFVKKMTEVRGFIRDDQKKEFFKKTFNDDNQASSIYSHIKKSKILHIMCETPVFCWLLATVVQTMGTTDKLPKTLVEMFCYFLTGETQREKMKNSAVDEEDKEKLMKDAGEVLLKLGRVAFDQLDKGNIIFYQKDLEDSGLDMNNIALYSGFCTTFFKKDSVFFLKPVYCFVHLSIQEFLAAVYLFHCFTQRNMKVLKTFLEYNDFNSDSSMSDFLKAAMKKALQSKSGHLDLFVRFLHGLSLESNQSLLGGLLGQTENSPEEIQRAINNLKEMNDPTFSPDRCINIFHCLLEMNDPSVSQGIEHYLESESRSGKELSVTQSSALATMLLMSEKVLEVLDLDKYNTNESGRQRLIPAVRNCTTARLVGCDLKKKHIEVVASALSSDPSHLRHLDLSFNILDQKDPKTLDLLCDALKSPHCRLETLRLVNCWLSERSCEVLAPAISSNSSHLRELDLTFNVLPESVLNNFSGLETLKVKHGGHEHWTNPQLLTRYLHPLTLDPNTANRKLCLSEDNRKVTEGEELQSYPDHPDRFVKSQVLCTEGLTGRCYWEVEWSGWVVIGVTYKGISRRGKVSELGYNDLSWCLNCVGGSYSFYHNSRVTDLPVSPSGSNRVAVYLDWPAGTVSFYKRSSDSLTHLYSFQSSFTEPLYPAFKLISYSSSSSSMCL